MSCTYCRCPSKSIAIADTYAAPEPPPLHFPKERNGFTGGGDAQGLAIGVLALPTWFVLLREHEEAWIGGANIVMGAGFGLFAQTDSSTGRWPLASRVAWLAGMGGLAAYELSQGDRLSDASLAWTNVGGVILTLLATDWLFTH